MSAFKLDDFLPYQLSVLARKISADFERIYADQFQLSLTEWRVIAHLSQASHVSVREVHKKVDMDKSKVSRAADRLVSRGLVTKIPGRTDGRLIELALTEKGQEMMEQIVPLAVSFNAKLCKDLKPEGRAAIRALAIRQKDK